MHNSHFSEQISTSTQSWSRDLDFKNQSFRELASKQKVRATFWRCSTQDFIDNYHIIQKFFHYDHSNLLKKLEIDQICDEVENFDFIESETLGRKRHCYSTVTVAAVVVAEFGTTYEGDY